MTLRMTRATRALVLLAAAGLLAACGDKTTTGSEGAVAAANQPAMAAKNTPAAADEPAGKAGNPPAGKAEAPPAKTDRVEVYYFHGTRRCGGCIAIQRGIARAIQERFAAETASGDVVFREIDFDRPENRKLAGEFQVSFSTMVVAAKSGETTIEWENCDGVWRHGRNPTAMGDYVEERVRAHQALLKGN